MTDIELIAELQEIKTINVNVNNYRAIRDVFNTDCGIPELSNIKRRIENCILCGEFLPAMLTTNFFLEYFCKISLIYNYLGIEKNDNINIHANPFALSEELKIPTDLYDEEDLGKNLKNMRKVELLNDSEFQRLEIFKNRYRNSLSHANRKKIYEDVSVPIESTLFQNNKIEILGKKNEKLYLLPFSDFIFINKFCEENSIPYFLELDLIIKSVVKKIFSHV